MRDDQDVIITCVLYNQPMLVENFSPSLSAKWWMSSQFLQGMV